MIKELRGIRSDRVTRNLSVDIVDEDHSDLLHRIADGLTSPTFKSVTGIAGTEMDAALDYSRVAGHDAALWKQHTKVEFGVLRTRSLLIWSLLEMRLLDAESTTKLEVAQARATALYQQRLMVWPAFRLFVQTIRT